ncbi:hypothetical protein RN001_000534 [Aquatica leii]|uniref:CHK kinase-like domain-containing protein n=1 Tax=Aquatica leii TaxID=1421715 RepID=A0AAN7SQK6_9COLE|nr:hypothetical protein RN001_000534 [Aquatica leii]
MEGNLHVLNKTARSLVNQFLNDFNINKCKINVTPGTSQGDNYIGLIYKIQIETKSSTTCLILKSAQEEEKFRKLCLIPVLFSRETYIYEKVLFEFDRFQKDKGIENPFLSYVKYFGSKLDPPNECILMLDMTNLGYKVLDRKDLLNYNHVISIVKEYGRFHALSLALFDQKPSVFEEISKNVETIYSDFDAANMDPILDMCIAKALQCIDPIVDKSIYEKCLRFKEHAFQVVQKIVRSETSGKYSVVCHCDAWINNIPFKYSDLTETKNPSELCFIDWQLAQLGSPVLDLTTFLFLSTNKEFRDIYYDDVIKEYYNSFSGFLKELGSDPEELFPFSVLQEHLKTFSVFAFFRVIQALHLLLSDKENIPDFKDTDFDDLGFKENETYNTRMREIMLDFDRLGYEL